MAQGRDRYGVASNPFTLGPLDPFKNSAAADARLLVDGFKQLADIRTAIGLGREQGIPVFIFVTGPKGAGRRSLEHAIFQVWCEISKVDLKRFAQVRVKADNESELDLLQAWVGQLAAKLQGFRGLPSVELIDQINSAISISSLVQLKAKIQSLLPMVYDEMLEKAKPTAYGIGACFVEVRRKMVDGICSLFQDTPRVCVVTASEREPFGRDLRLDMEGLSVYSELGPLSREEITDLALQRWGKKSEIPFDISAVENFFKGRNSYVGVVLSRLFSLFERMSAAHAGEGGIWPDDRTVYYGPDQVKATLDQIERGI